MNSPGIEVAWGGGVWRRSQRRVIEDSIHCAKDLAEYGLDYLGLTYEQTKKLTVYKVAKHSSIAGESKGPVEMDIHIPVHHIKHRKVAATLAGLANTVLHETVHCIRSENFNTESIVETAASEGLAYISEDIVGNALLPQADPSSLRNLVNIASSVHHDIAKACLLDDDELSLPDTPEAIQVFDIWFGDNCGRIPQGVLIGVTEVCRRLEEGNSIADMMHWPAEEILDLDSHFMTPTDSLKV
jgi:hypothetical protein